MPKSSLESKQDTPLPRPNVADDRFKLSSFGFFEDLQAMELTSEAINTLDRTGYSMLMYACKNGHIDVVKLLLDKGADPNLVGCGGRTSLMISVSSGRESVCRLLLENNASISMKDESGNSALHYAARTGIMNTTTLLVESGANVNETNNFGSTPLHTAAGSGQQSVLDYLIEKEVDINAANQDNNTALHIASTIGFPRICMSLLHTPGINTQIRNRQSKIAEECTHADDTQTKKIFKERHAMSVRRGSSFRQLDETLH